MRQDVFVVAYQEARSELLDITSKFEQLRQRKERLEGVVVALGPMLGIAASASALAKSAVPVPVAEGTTQPAYTFNQVAAPEQDEESATTDPFQQRLRNALKFSSPRHEGLRNAM
jgi:hypothetical protein